MATPIHMASAIGPAALPLSLNCFQHNHSLRPQRLPLMPPAPLRRLAISNSGSSLSSVAGKEGLEEDQETPLPEQSHDEEWQARQRQKTKEWHAYRKKEEEAENTKIEEFRGIAQRLDGYPEEDILSARRLVSSFIRAGKEVEERIEEAGENGELTEVVLMVIWNRLDLARRDDEKDAIRSLDLLYRRVEREILKQQASPAMRLLDELLNLDDGSDERDWLRKCRKRMVNVFPPEDPCSILVPAGFDIETHEGNIPIPDDDDDMFLRVDFIREVAAFLKEVKEQNDKPSPEGLDVESVGERLKQQEKKRTIHQVELLLELAVNLNR